MGKNNVQSDKKHAGTKYSWKVWCMVIAEIAIIVLLLVGLFLSVKAIVQNVQMLCFKNKVEGTVTVAEYKGGKTAYNESGSGTSTQYEQVHYVIKFDSDESGYSQYEYRADNMISTRKYEGQRFLVLFNEIENPTLIQKEDIVIDNVILISFVLIGTTMIVLRKKIWLWIIKLSDKVDSYI